MTTEKNDQPYVGPTRQTEAPEHRDMATYGGGHEAGAEIPWGLVGTAGAILLFFLVFKGAEVAAVLEKFRMLFGG